MKSPSCCFRSETLAPVLKGKPPANFDARREREISRRDVQAGKPHEFVRMLQFDRPEAPATLSNKSLATVSHCITCSTIKRSGEKFHDFWVCVQRGKWFAVG